MSETWITIDDFPDYAVSSEGRVLNKRTDFLKIPSLNQQGIPNVLLVRDGVQHRRSVAVLVAQIFLEPPPADFFDTPINLNGDREDNRAVNLAWRPRWFAVRYHQQFRRPPFQFTSPLMLEQTEELFDNPRDAAMTYGLLEEHIVRDLANQTGVFPQGFTFHIHDVA